MIAEAAPLSRLIIAAVLVGLSLLVESVLSWRNERRLRARGAIDAPDDVWRAMAVAYPLAFAAMFIEGVARGGPSSTAFAIGVLVWVAAKALKSWAIASLGDRWSFRVLVVPGASLVTRGPYRWLRHPNYVAVAGELVGTAFMTASPFAGPLFTLVFIEIMRRRIRVEERMLGLS